MRSPFGGMSTGSAAWLLALHWCATARLVSRSYLQQWLAVAAILNGRRLLAIGGRDFEIFHLVFSRFRARPAPRCPERVAFGLR